MGKAPRRNPRPENVTAVECELRLKQRRRRHAGKADQRIVCRHHDAIEADPVSIRFDATFFRIEFAGRRLFENVRAVPGTVSINPPEIFSRMKFRLVGEPNSRHAKMRDRFEITQCRIPSSGQDRHLL